MRARLSEPAAPVMSTRSQVLAVLAGLAGGIVGLACAVVLLALRMSSVPTTPPRRLKSPARVA